MRVGITERGDGGFHFDQWLSKMNTVDAAIIISKRPDILLQRCNEIPDNTIIHCSITGAAGTLWEPNSIPVNKAFNCYIKLANKFGYNRVVLRVDPIIPTEWSKAATLINAAYTNEKSCRIRVSIMDLYKHVEQRLINGGFTEELNKLKKYYKYGIHANNFSRKWIINEISYLFPNVEICGEPGFKNTGCISKIDLITLGIPIPPKTICTQRTACACLGNKTELLNNKRQCPNKCLYCYWR
jgi:hypothetical protein